eukprot:CAMPEP_0181456184 /NCGR_PEP_ID=MMETSP1110-20121109/31141_1 /TAXON_ID=174948 /ORGANISM="Symbiodinium sp., Strain CCMP421" /LENGTH=50 /DNA_ID=CAMNT_0023580589 /DNA_START=105 /DNA_END=254 /DNA_ORIENTATION=+
MVACQLNMSSPTGPAEQFAGGSLAKSVNSFVMRLSAMTSCSLPCLHSGDP